MNYIKEINIRGADYSGAMLAEVVPFDAIFQLNGELSILNVNRLNRKDGKSEQIHAIRFLRPGKMSSVDQTVSAAKCASRLAKEYNQVSAIPRAGP